MCIRDSHSRVEDTAKLWEELLAQPFAAERVIILDQGAYQAQAGALVVQALHHGNAPQGADLRHSDRGRHATSGRPGVGVRGRNPDDERNESRTPEDCVKSTRDIDPGEPELSKHRARSRGDRV